MNINSLTPKELEAFAYTTGDDALRRAALAELVLDEHLDESEQELDEEMSRTAQAEAERDALRSILDDIAEQVNDVLTLVEGGELNDVSRVLEHIQSQIETA